MMLKVHPPPLEDISVPSPHRRSARQASLNDVTVALWPSDNHVFNEWYGTYFWQIRTPFSFTVGPQWAVCLTQSSTGLNLKQIQICLCNLVETRTIDELIYSCWALPQESSRLLYFGIMIAGIMIVVRHSARVSPLVTAPPPLPQNTVIGPDQVGFVSRPFSF